MYEFKNPNPEKLLLKVRVVLERNTVSGGSGQGIIIAERVGWGGESLKLLLDQPSSPYLNFTRGYTHKKHKTAAVVVITVLSLKECWCHTPKGMLDPPLQCQYQSQSALLEPLAQTLIN